LSIQTDPPLHEAMSTGRPPYVIESIFQPSSPAAWSAKTAESAFGTLYVSICPRSRSSPSLSSSVLTPPVT